MKKIIVPILCSIFIIGLISGCVEEETTENTAPEAGFTYELTDMTITFTDTSTDADEDDTLTYSWDFDGDDVEDSTEQNPTYDYTENGTYTVTLTVSDGTDSDTYTEDVIVGNIAPTADFTSEATDLSVVFTDASTDPNGDETITAWSWNFGDESDANITQNPTYVYAAAGTYNVTLTVTDDYGLTGEITQEITITAAE